MRDRRRYFNAQSFLLAHGEHCVVSMKAMTFEPLAVGPSWGVRGNPLAEYPAAHSLVG